MPPDMVPLAGLGVLVGQRTEKASGRKNPEWPYVGLEHLDSGSPFLNGKAPSGASMSTNNVFYRGDVLFGKLRPYLRKSVGAPFCGYCSTDILVLRAGEGVDPGYVAKIFQSDAVFSRANATAIGTKMPRTSWESLRGLEVFSPPLPEQRRIAKILDTLDEAIRKTEQVIAKLQQMKQGLLHDLLTRGIDENGELRDPERHPEQFKDSPLGRIPRGWEVKMVNQFADTYAGGTPSREIAAFYGGGIPWVKSGEVNRDEILFTEETITKAALIASSAKWVETDTPLVAMYGATAGAVSWLKIRATTNQAVLAFHVESAISSRWLYWALKQATPSLLATVQGSGQPNLSKSVIERVRLAVPCDKREQDAIARRADEMHARMRSEDIELSKIRTLKQGLMDDLLTGRVRVPHESEAAAE